ncbi:MAG: hypothetical protein WD069_10880 [Planctomycetales bacterium]
MLSAGTARTCITPWWGIELTGWGYYVGRTWREIHDDLYATAVVIEDRTRAIAIVSLDLMVVGAEFTREVRERVAAETGIPPEHVLVACTHTHNAPAAEGLLGAGETDPDYERFAARQAATAVILAWNSRVQVHAFAASTPLAGHTFNRTREGGPVDTTLTTLRLDRRDGSTLAMVVNFQAHPTVWTKLRPFAVARDVPGQVCKVLEGILPGATALYLQGACGDVNFLRDDSTPERRDQPEDYSTQLVQQMRRNPVTHITMAVQVAQMNAVALEPVVAAASHVASVPTRRWTREEIEPDRNEAQRRLAARDISGWRETLGRSLTNNPEDMIARHGGDEWKAVEAMCRFHLAWTYEMLQDFETRPEVLPTEVQALVVGELAIVANSSELFSAFALDLRHRAGTPHLMIACYSNGRIGYMPDDHDIAAKSYAAWTSPKYCLQFPFTPRSGPELCDGMLGALADCRSATQRRS